MKRLFAFALAVTTVASIALSSCSSTGPAIDRADGGRAALAPVPAPEDDTAYLQSLLDSWDETIVIPARKRPWQTDPLFLSVSGKTVVFAEGCVVESREGSFSDPGDCLLTVYDSENVVIEGYGATLRMRGDDYRKSPYEKGQWRHGIALFTCKNVRIEGLTVEKTGGDGVYIGQEPKTPVCESIALKDLRLKKNHRQGVSVIAVKGFLMDSCEVSGTGGNLPMAGIDFEPNSGVYGLTGCEIRDCDFRDNKGAGIQVYLIKMTGDQPPVDLIVERTRSRGNRFSVVVNGIKNGVSGAVIFRDCNLSSIRHLSVSESFSVRFE